MKQARIKNLREFIPLAVIYGYKLYDTHLVKSINFYPDEEVYIKINIHNGLIHFHHYYKDCEINALSLDDKQYLLRNIDYMVEWIEEANNILRRK